MFKLTLKHKPDGKSGQEGVITWAETGNSVCNVESWSFASCGVGALTKLSYTRFTSAKQVDAFFNFVCANVADDWNPNEFYFLLTDGQLKMDNIKFMVNHPNVKRRDVFMNKSHGPNKLHLFRYSKDKDFKALRPRKPKVAV
jgi:hypothetical protein